MVLQIRTKMWLCDCIRVIVCCWACFAPLQALTWWSSDPIECKICHLLCHTCTSFFFPVWRLLSAWCKLQRWDYETTWDEHPCCLDRMFFMSELMSCSVWMLMSGSMLGLGTFPNPNCPWTYFRLQFVWIFFAWSCQNLAHLKLKCHQILEIICLHFCVAWKKEFSITRFAVPY